MKKWQAVFCSVLVFFLFTTFAYGQQVEIRILHVNDFHGFAEPYKPLGSDEPLGGIPYLAAKVNELRKGKPSLLLSAGDMIQGNNWANLFQGESVMEWMNEMRFDAMVLGNHEFDFGQEVLKKRISEARFPILGANVEGSGPSQTLCHQGTERDQSRGHWYRHRRCSLINPSPECGGSKIYLSDRNRGEIH